ncbi:MAG TPA: guanylate kinase [Gemmatimonadales bacterium]|nr:guanylate kinase [Gemmatimonadales bacterium]
MRPFLLVLSSPSGGGKSTIARHLLMAREDLGYSVSATTRAPRPGEQDGVDYHFIPVVEFTRRVDAGEFVEWAEYGGSKYGTLKVEVERVMAEGRSVVLDIEVAGARQVRKAFPESVHVFVLPPSGTVLAQRLKMRRTDDASAQARRLAIAKEEIGAAVEYDYVVVNDDLVTAVAQVAAILDAEGRRTRRMADLDETVARLRADLK